jgi:hypothetical protein
MKLWQQRLLSWWLCAMGAWPLVPWDLHDHWRSYPAGALMITIDWLCHSVGILAVMTLFWFDVKPTARMSYRLWREKRKAGR